MPSVRLLPTSSDGNDNVIANTNPLPQLLHTPSGLALIELQGSVLTEEETSDVSSALNLGKLIFPAADEHGTSEEWDGKRVFLLVGHHQRLTGEVKKLAKPLGLLRRKTTASAQTDEVEIAEVCRYKIIFSHRPEPVGAARHVLHDE